MQPKIAVILPLNQDYCIECGRPLSSRVSQYAKKKYDMPLCEPCQRDFVHKCQKASKKEILLFKALVKSGVAAKLQKYDLHKTVDIMVPEAMVHIEVDGSHHNTKAAQALSDIQRTYHSLKAGYMTIRIPNSLINHHFDEALKYIIGILAVRRDQLKFNSRVRVETFTTNRKIR
jgi:very-short-patch-repair endonuclease